MREDTVFPPKSCSYACTLAVLLSVAPSLAVAADSLQIYFVDVEGGGATLIVAPSGQSMLVDSGNPPPNAERDSKRILAAMHAGGVKQINYLFPTHSDGD